MNVYVLGGGGSMRQRWWSYRMASSSPTRPSKGMDMLGGPNQSVQNVSNFENYAKKDHHDAIMPWGHTAPHMT